jgi:hypothetical protein
VARFAPIVALVLVILLVERGDARAGGEAALPTELSLDERERLLNGKSVKRKFHLEVNDVTYRAGLAYRLVRSTPLEVVSALRSPKALARAIPYGLDAVQLGERDGVARVRIRQGKPPVVGGYTVRMKWELNQYRARFWLDPNDVHDLKDIWGSFSAREVSPGLTLICFAVAFDLGGVGEILGSKVHRWSLSTADRVAELVEEKTGIRYP